MKRDWSKVSDGPSNNICTALNYAYAELVVFESRFTLSQNQLDLIETIKRNLEITNPMNKYATEKLHYFKLKSDPDYQGQRQFFVEDVDYVEELKKDVQKIIDSKEKYDIDNIKRDIVKLNKEEIDFLEKYDLIKRHRYTYYLALELQSMLKNDEMVKEFEGVLDRFRHILAMSARMCRKLEEYHEKYPDESQYDFEYHAMKEVRSKIGSMSEATKEYRERITRSGFLKKKIQKGG